MYLINESFFTRELSIPGIEDAGRALADLELFIDERVRLFLLDLLGRVDFEDLDSQITNGTLNDDADQRWKDFVNGATYETDYTWKGLLQEYGSYRTSALAYYVYYYWLLENNTYVSGVGEVRAEAKNAISVNPTQRLTEVWNKFVLMYQGGAIFTPIRDIYHVGVPQYNGKYIYNGLNDDVSMVQFFNQNISIYPNVNLRYYGVKNQLGI